MPVQTVRPAGSRAQDGGVADLAVAQVGVDLGKLPPLPSDEVVETRLVGVSVQAVERLPVQDGGYVVRPLPRPESVDEHTTVILVAVHVHQPVGAGLRRHLLEHLRSPSLAHRLAKRRSTNQRSAPPGCYGFV